MTTSGLAAVHLAAAATTTALQTALQSQPPGAIVSLAPGEKLPAPAAATTTTTADLVAAYPELCNALRLEGATAERSRILGIEAHALPGHDKLIADMKADASVTPDMAAGRILAAERQLRGNQLQAIADVERLTGKVPAAPSASAAPASGSEKATTPEGWKAEYAASPQLQAEFASAEDYVSLKRAEASGKVRVLGGRSAS
ncbi:hypothetical protein [Bradyrhizobium sp. DOA9]|uniref:hypothetical protein n=1 Tax=Bradyrhizobium sp. DOA9 TaxID=1126627 RepID=UPI0005A8EFFC|nr:hypothetical protein [Bradyrhizobium sp. DOA9]GAJ35160.1 hypothetical protein BDOA9_0143590 [Bradyrhizobium sp. DOA9]